MASPLHSPPQALTPDNGSFPRKEFHITPRRNPSSFSLLCFAGSNLLRLYAFPSSVVSVFRRYFGKGIHSEKTDHNNNFTQFELEGKLWTNKSLSTERLVVEMLSIIYQSGFTYLSTIDYGRESDDRLAIAFSRPSLPSELSVPSASSSPKAPSLAPIPDQPKLRVPFALSFPSSIVLRVICPPLHLTPAILQAVRGAWPRGVQSEKKVGENSFEFKLKGYRWFQEDTFATDSLRYILTLLSSLDAHSFTLQASISLTNRSRNKDFWIFTGPPPPDGIDSPAPSILNSSHPDLHGQQASGVHTRLATEPITSSSPLPPSYHARAATDNMGRKSPQYLQHSPGGSSGSLPSPGLRKAAPRAQIPVSVHDTDGEILEISGYRADLPSVIPDGAENMTGVGAQPTPDVFYTTSPFGPLSAAPIPLSSSPGAAASQQQSHTPSFESTHGDTPQTPSPKPVETDREGELLSPGVFKDSGIYRDSTFSSMSDMSAEIPIKWTGANRESQQISEERRTSEGPKFPGGWEATPIEEKEESDAAREASFDFHLDQNKEPEQPVHDVRVASPEITRPGNETRKSEAGLIELNTATPPPPPPMPTSDNISSGTNTKEKQREAGSGVGWVLVNIEGRNGDGSVASPVPQGVDGATLSSVAVESHSDGKNDPSEVTSLVKPPSAPSTPKTKAIVIVDNPGGKKGKQKKDSSRIKRLLSLTRRDSKAIEMSPAQTQRSRMSSLRGGIPEAKRNDDGRRSFH